MGKQNLIDMFKEWLIEVSFELFLWSINRTKEEYWKAIMEQEQRHSIDSVLSQCDDYPDGCQDGACSKYASIAVPYCEKYGMKTEI